MCREGCQRKEMSFPEHMAADDLRGPPANMLVLCSFILYQFSWIADFY